MEKHYLIKNVHKKKFEKHFGVNTINSLLYFLFVLVGCILYSGFIEKLNVIGFVFFFVPSLLVFLVVFLFLGWGTSIGVSLLTLIVLYFLDGEKTLFFSFFLLGGTVMLGFIQVAKEWERAVILRLGRFKKVKGPGVFFLFPIIDIVTEIIDMRIRVTDFVAESTLTNDSVPITVDALVFWLVWDAEKAVLEVENYLDAVVMSSQTALREVISKNSLNDLLNDKENIKEEIRKIVDHKTDDWGVTIQYIEITEINVPNELQASLSIKAKAEREKDALIYLSEAEITIANNMIKASEIYKENEKAYSLRKLSILKDGLKEGNAMIMDSELIKKTDSEPIGLKALSEIRKNEK